GEPVFAFDDEVDAVLAVDETSDSKEIGFSNPRRARFDFEFQMARVPNSSPVFTSVPELVAEVDQPYVALIGGYDREQDPIERRLLEGPEQMTLQGETLRWTPAEDDVGNHRVQLQISDGNGGVSTRTFQLLVPNANSNRSPLILSVPPQLATVGDALTYEINAIDPDGETVEFSLSSTAPAGATMDGSRLSWTPDTTQVGSHVVTILANDQRGGVGRQTFELSVRELNTAPVFTTTAIVSAVAGEQYFYDAEAFDAEDDLSYSILGPIGMTIDRSTGNLVWPAADVAAGEYPIHVMATDDRGLTASQEFLLVVARDDVPPQVEVASTRTVLRPGETTRLSVFARDNVELQSLRLTIDGEPVIIDEASGFDYVAQSPGFANVRLMATDTSGNDATIELTPPLRIVDPSDTTPPTISLLEPVAGESVTYLTNIVGSVLDDNLEYYELQVALSGTEDFRTIAREVFEPGSGGEGIDGAVLGTFDPTLLANDFYDVRLIAQDVSGNVSMELLTLSVEGNAKLGNYRISMTDLTIPVAGIPIEIHRTYDTLDAAYSGDFGYGWKLEMVSPRIRESVPVSTAEAAGAGIFGANAFRMGSRVYFNAPDGRRVGFTFDPVPEPQLIGTLWRPRFIADPGVFHQLHVEDVPLQQNSDGTFGLYLIGFPYNPDTYTLVTKDQLRFTYSQFDAIELQHVEDRNGVRLTFDEFGIHSSAGPRVIWTRDALGRIKSIIDPEGNEIAYEYSEQGDLVRVTDAVGDSMSFTYFDEPAHYLDSVTDARNITVAASQYDASGRLISESDGSGSVATRQYDLAQNHELLGDRLGNETLLVFDDRGNTVQVTDPLGNSMFMSFDANDNLVEHVDRDGFVTRLDYDSRGNLLSVIDALGGVQSYEYDSRNEVTKFTDALNRVTEFRFDDNGNLLSTLNAAGDTTSVTRDELGRQLAFTDQFGLETRFEYQTATTIASRVIWPDGTSRFYDVSRKGMITAVTDERGSRSEFVFDGAGRRIGLIDADGGEVSFGYTDGFLTSMT
ncbi:MAG: putative Ig domain-containing protein, partial [Planctomycetota bacterium]